MILFEPLFAQHWLNKNALNGLAPAFLEPPHYLEDVGSNYGGCARSLNVGFCHGVPCWVSGPVSDRCDGRHEALMETWSASCIWPISVYIIGPRVSLVAQRVKDLPAMQKTEVQPLGRKETLEKGMATNPLQYSCLENSMDRGAWWAPVHGAAESWTRLKWLKMTLAHDSPGDVALFDFVID